MTEDFGDRLALLLALAVLGTTLGIAAGSIGAGGPILADEPAAEIDVSEDEISVSDGTEDVTIVEEIDGVGLIEFEADSSGLQVETEPDDHFTPAERDQARQIASDNETVHELLEPLETYDLVVEPIETVEAGELREFEVDVYQPNTTDRSNDTDDPTATPDGEELRNLTPNETATGEEVTVEFEQVGNESDESVSIHRNVSYLEDEAAVVVRDSEGDAVLRAIVDLAAETVIRIDDPEAE